MCACLCVCSMCVCSVVEYALVVRLSRVGVCCYACGYMGVSVSVCGGVCV